MKRKILELLNIHFGDSKGDKEKEDIADFIEKNKDEIYRIIYDDGYFSSR